MGHYRSEMGFEDEDRREAEHRERCMKEATAKIEALIAEKGVARALAEVVADPFRFRVPRR